MLSQLRPPSVVRTSEVHGAREHGALPSPQPSSALTKVRSLIFMPLGTGPPAGPIAGPLGWGVVDVGFPWEELGEGLGDTGLGLGAGTVGLCVGAAGGVGAETCLTSATAA